MTPVRTRTATSTTAVVTALALALAPALPAVASHDVTPARVAGQDRYETAAAVARLLAPGGSSSALLASGTEFPDALAGASLAAQQDGPLLLTGRQSLPAATERALSELGTQRVTVLGGEAAVSATVLDRLRARGLQVTRVAGSDRYATAAEVARRVLSPTTGNFPGGRRAVFIANGERFPDALSASGPSASSPAQIPVLLSAGDRLPAATAAVLRELDVELAVLVGGQAALSEDVRRQLEGLGVTVTRIDGADRTDTATSVASFAEEYLDFDADTYLVARGDDFTDALAAGPLAGARRDPVLLTWSPARLTSETAAYLSTRCGAVRVVRAVGGTSAVTPSTLDAAEAAAEQCHGDGTAEQGQTFLVAPQEPLSAAPGADLVFDVGRRYDSGAFRGPVDVGLLPCRNADVVGSGPDVFRNADGDGTADGLGGSDTGSARIVRVDGTATSGAPTVLRDAAPDEDGDLDLALRADTGDCVVLLVFDDTDGDGGLDVDASGRATEPYGVGQATWR